MAVGALERALVAVPRERFQPSLAAKSSTANPYREYVEPDALQWAASARAPNESPLRVESTGAGVSLRLRDSGDIIAQFAKRQQPVAYTIDKNRKYVAALKRDGGISIFSLAHGVAKREIANTPGQYRSHALEWALAASVPAMAVAYGQLMDHAQPGQLWSDFGWAVGGTFATGLGFVKAAAMAHEYLRGKRQLAQVVVDKTIAFSTDGRSLDRVVPDGVARLNLHTREDTLVPAREAIGSLTLTREIHNALFARQHST